MDLCYDSLNVQSRFSSGLLYIHQAGIVALAMQEPSSQTSQASNSCYHLYYLVLVSGLPQLKPLVQTPGGDRKSVV